MYKEIEEKEINSLPRFYCYEVEKPGIELKQPSYPLSCINVMIAKPVTEK